MQHAECLNIDRESGCAEGRGDKRGQWAASRTKTEWEETTNTDLANVISEL